MSFGLLPITLLKNIVLTTFLVKGLPLMHMANVTDIRQNASKIISEVVSTRESAVILQRSKPVAYIVEADTYDRMVSKLAEAEAIFRVENAKAALRDMAQLRDDMAQRGKQRDSVEAIREMREGRFR